MLSEIGIGEECIGGYSLKQALSMKISQSIEIAGCALIASLLSLPVTSATEPTTFYSPSNTCVVQVVQTDQGLSRLEVFRDGHELSHYSFEGNVASIYWSHSEKFAAINNHNGHRGWYLWIISLDTGAVIRANDALRSTDYNR